MRWIAGGRFRMGSDLHDAEEALVRTVALDDSWTDETPVANRQFKRLNLSHGHRTSAEIPPNPNDYPGALPHMLYAGSLAFVPQKGAIDQRAMNQW